MSEETPQTPDNDGALDLSGLNFGPAWARDDSESKSLKKFKDRGDRGDSRDRGQRDNRGGGDRGRRDNRGGGGGRDQRGGGGFKGKGRGGRRDDRDDRRPQRQEVEPPEGVKIKIMPSEESLDLLAKQVADTGRTFSVFDLAKVLLQKRDRFRVIFESPEKKYFRCREDNSLWLNKDEAVRHLWRGEWRKKYYSEVKTEGEAPKGSFSSVARCGISGEYLGPPNYHGYQQNIATLHRERFGNMSLDAYKAKVRMEHGEEAVAAWLETMKIVTKWRVGTGEEEVVAEEEAPAEAAPEEEKAEETVAEETAAEETAAEESATEEAAVEEAAPEAAVEEAVPESEEAPAEAEEETPAVEEAPAEVEPEPEASGDDEVLLSDSREVERHFAENFFEKAFEETERAWVMGDIAGNLLSPGFLTLLKRTVAEEKRYPANLMPLVCRQLSGRHVAVFKWNKKLKVGPSRPHAVSAETPLSERPQAIIDFLSANSGKQLKDLWATLLPQDASDEVKHEWFHDLHWLLNQGHAILLSDTTLHLAKSGDSAAAPKKKRAPKKKAKKVGEPAAGDSGQEGPKAEEPSAEDTGTEEKPKAEDPVVEATETKEEPKVEDASEVETPKAEIEAPKEEEVSEPTPEVETPAPEETESEVKPADE